MESGGSVGAPQGYPPAPRLLVKTLSPYKTGEVVGPGRTMFRHMVGPKAKQPEGLRRKRLGRKESSGTWSQHNRYGTHPYPVIISMTHAVPEYQKFKAMSPRSHGQESWLGTDLELPMSPF